VEVGATAVLRDSLIGTLALMSLTCVWHIVWRLDILSDDLASSLPTADEKQLTRRARHSQTEADCI
jgi:hypothetical protein